MPDPLDPILIGATLAAQRPYALAVAADIEGRWSNPHWEDFTRITARVLVLSFLHGYASLDLDFEEDDRDIEIPDRFDARFEDITIGPFREAVESLRSRVPRLAQRVHELIRHAKTVALAITRAERRSAAERILSVLRRSFFVSGTDQQTTERLHELVARAVRGEQNLPDFIDSAKAQGAANLTRARLETVYRNNVSLAFGEGQVAAVESPEAQRTFPLVERIEIRDRRTRGNPRGLYPDRGFHFQMHGYVNSPAVFRRYGLIGPAGHNCRGTTRPISAVEAIQRGFMEEDGKINHNAISAHNGARQTLIDSGQFPDPGWGARAA